MSASIIPPPSTGSTGTVNGAVAPINFNSGTGILSLTGVVALANGGTGQATQLAAANALGIERMSVAGGDNNTKYLTNTPPFEGHFGIDYFGNKQACIHWAGSTTQGDYKHGICFPHGLAIVGDGDNMDPLVNPAGGAGQVWAQNGCPTNWNRAGDATLILKNYSANAGSSGTGLTMAVMTSGFAIATVTMTSGGTAYSVGDNLAFTGGTFAPAAAIGASIVVTGVSSGVITTFAFRTGGEYSVAPTSPNTPTGGTGTGATFTFTAVVKAVTAMQDNSSSYMHEPNTGGAGLIAGNAYFVMNYNATYNKGWAVCAPGGATGAPDGGNFSLQYNDFANKMFRIPFWVASAYQPTDVGWLDTFTASASTGNCTIKNALSCTNVNAERDALGANTSTCYQLTNITAAAAGAQQWSPCIQWTCSGWKTTATAASQTVEFRQYVLPIQGAAAPTGTMTFDSRIAGGSWNNAATLTDAGLLTTVSGITAGASITCGSGNGFIISTRSQVKSSANGTLQFLNNANSACASITYLETSTTKTTAYTVLVTDAGTAFDNIGAGSEVVFTLPAASKGLHFSIIVQNAVGCKFTATGSATIRDGGSVSAANGSIDSTTVGSCLHIVAISGTEWYVDCKNGTWNAPV